MVSGIHPILPHCSINQEVLTLLILENGLGEHYTYATEFFSGVLTLLILENGLGGQSILKIKHFFQWTS